MATKLGLHHIEVCGEQSGVHVTGGVLEFASIWVRSDKK
jgi:hypothetical protein